jgi:hypothetical protein
MYAELGAALALNVTAAAPKIYLLGAMNHMSVFYFHPSVTRLNSTDALIKALE